jgi:hypothetical protein
MEAHIGFEISGLPHFLDSWLTDGGEVSLTLRPPSTPRKIHVICIIAFDGIATTV